MPEVRFTCPNCERLIPLDLTTDALYCPYCGESYRLVHMGGETGWSLAEDGPLWHTQRIQPLHRRVKFVKQETSRKNTGTGRARARRLKRQQRKSRLPLLGTGFFALGLIAVLWFFTLFAGDISGIVLAAELIPESWETTQFIPTDPFTPTATPLPHNLVTATAWQATLDQAIANSHAMQTQNVLKDFATQTALPPLLTAMASDRNAIATQTANANSGVR
jgi:DNA-directed RNA polymerase subunit RPC12/RpoP